MSRLLILLIFGIWLTPQEILPPRGPLSPAAGTAIFLGGYALLVGAMGLWARLICRRLGSQHSHRSLHWFNWAAEGARVAVPAWLAISVWILGWPEALDKLIRPVYLLGRGSDGQAIILVGPWLLAGTLPALAAWVGLWWAQYPADRACREQNMPLQLDEGLPVHSPPKLGGYLAANIRQQLLFMLVPAMIIFLARDLLIGGLWFAGRNPRGVEDWAMLPLAAGVYLVAPELLRWVLKTRPLPDSPLRRRLEAMCRRSGLRYRNILLWHTDYSMGNAAVMGLIPRLRYVMLSDLLLETMTDRQIEAVFAHEVGHIVHRHMAWYAAFFFLLMLATIGPGQTLDTWLKSHLAARLYNSRSFEAVYSIATLAGMLMLFGFLSRRFERQADVYAARLIQSEWAGTLGAAPHLVPATFLSPALPEGGGPGSLQADPLSPARCHVGEQGAAIFASALHRVALINNIPVRARSWCHGSIARRMRYLYELSGDPRRTSAFDHFMRWLYLAMGLTIVACGVWAALANR